MNKKFIISQPRISKNLINSFREIFSESDLPQLVAIKDNFESLANLEHNSELLVPVYFNKDLNGNFIIENAFIRKNLISQSYSELKIRYVLFNSENSISLDTISNFLQGRYYQSDTDIYDDFIKSSLTQKSLIENFTNKLLDEKVALRFFDIFYNLSDSGSESPNYKYLFLQKLDKIDQQLDVIRNIPFYLRTNSIFYRLFLPAVNSFRSIKEKSKNVLTKFKLRAKVQVEKSNKVIDTRLKKFFDISNRKIDSNLIKIPQFDNYDLSIIIPVYGKLDFLARCLYSLQLAKTDLKYEVIIVDDCGPKLVSSKFNEKLNGVKIYKNKKNLGFTNTCNNGAALAKGKFICFLNSDTIATDYWSDNLLNGFKLAKNIGVVGSKLMYENGDLQEAGGIVFSNGDAANIGKNMPSDSSWYKYFKDVDYVSGAALAIQKQDFEEIGGFDKRFTPAYYEDTSLCMDVRHKLNKRVVVNPLSIVIHHEGATNGTDESSGFKRFMPINKEKFVEKHSLDLVNYGESYKNLWWDRDKYIKGNVLIIDQCIPSPSEDSGSKDMDNILRSLLNENYRPHLFALSNRGETPQTYGYYEKGVHCVFGQDNRSFKDFFKKYHSLFSLIIISRVNSYEEVEGIIEKYSPNTKTIFYTVDLHHVRLQSEYNQSRNIEVLRNAKNTKLLEIKAINRLDKTVVLSEKEKDYLITKNNINPEKILVWPLIRSEFENLSNFAKSKTAKDIIFIGGYRHTPNIEAVKLLERKIIPETVKIFEENGLEFPGVKLYGSAPTDYIKSLNSKQISYEGFIEEESDAFSQAKISLAPLPFGAGLKGKTLSSFIYKTPVVGSTFAFEGFDISNKNIMVEASIEPKDFALKIYKAYVNTGNIYEEEWNELITNLEKRFSYKSFSKIIKTDIDNLEIFG